MFQDHVDAVAEARVGRLTGQIAALLPNWSLAPVVEAVQAMRGVAFIVAVVAEVGGVHRFETPRQLMAYLGLTPSGHSSGSSIRRGGIDPGPAAVSRGGCRPEAPGTLPDAGPRQPQAARPDRGAAEIRARHRLEGAAADGGELGGTDVGHRRVHGQKALAP